jgi:hypothetical protein
MPKVGNYITLNENRLFAKKELTLWEDEGVELYKPVIHQIFPGACWRVGSNVW